MEFEIRHSPAFALSSSGAAGRALVGQVRGQIQLQQRAEGHVEGIAPHGAVDDRAHAHIAFDPGWLRRIASGTPEQLSIIRVEGDSMTPTLSDGDEILVDRGDGAFAGGVDRVRDPIHRQLPPPRAASTPAVRVTAAIAAIFRTCMRVPPLSSIAGRISGGAPEVGSAVDTGW